MLKYCSKMLQMLKDETRIFDICVYFTLDSSASGYTWATKTYRNGSGALNRFF